MKEARAKMQELLARQRYPEAPGWVEDLDRERWLAIRMGHRPRRIVVTLQQILDLDLYYANVLAWKEAWGQRDAMDDFLEACKQRGDRLIRTLFGLPVEEGNATYVLSGFKP